MKTKKRKKVSRMRGSHTHGRGFKKKARGKGHRGGIGKAGSGKRADQKKSFFIGKGRKYFGKDKALRRGAPKQRLKVINLSEILGKFKDQKEINLKGYKILSKGSLDSKLSIKASAASKSAIEKVKKADGNITII